MVATWNPAASSTYYVRGSEYYLGSIEPPGRWYAPAGDFGLIDNAPVERALFERLYAGLRENGASLISNSGGRTADRVPAYDCTLSAPRSVSLAWAFADASLKDAIEGAQERAIRAALDGLAREAMWARRGRGGQHLEPVALSAATFRHGESRPAEHADGRVFADPNLHTHCVILNLATRADGSIGAIHSKILRDWKMAAGATYHAVLAHELEQLGFGIDRVGYNGIFELAGVSNDVIAYFSARRQEIEEELAEHAVTSREAAALASAITRATRDAKATDPTRPREEVWAEAAAAQGIDVTTFTSAHRLAGRTADLAAGERLFAERLAALPQELTETTSVIERRDLVRAVTAALIGTGLPVERADQALEEALTNDIFVEIGHDGYRLPRYSTPEMIQLEAEVVTLAHRLASSPRKEVDQGALVRRCKSSGLSAEQIEAARMAVNPVGLAIIEGAPGSGKTTTLAPVVAAYREAGFRVLGSATAWRIARMLADDLAIEARATASWIAKARAGETVLDQQTVLIVDESGLLSSRDMHTLLSLVTHAGAKLLLCGDRGQLQAIGAGPGLDLVSRALEAARVETIIRQREPWARDTVRAFGSGRADEALRAFAERGHLIEAPGARAAVREIVDRWQLARGETDGSGILLLAKSNANVAAISREVRERLKAEGMIRGPEIEVAAVTPSGHASTIHVAAGDRIRFLVRNDVLEVINGTTAVVTKVSERADSQSPSGRKTLIEADVEGRRVTFDPRSLADEHGRARLGWAYASSIYGSQGLTVERSIVLVDPSLDRYDIYVGASRARGDTTLVVDAAAIDRRLQAERPLDEQSDAPGVTSVERRAWLAARLTRANPKLSTVAVVEASQEYRTQQCLTCPQIREFDHQI